MIKALLLLIALTGCTETIKYVPVQLDLPQAMPLPVIKGSELQRINNDTYRRLRQRDSILRNRVSDLELIIKSTQSKR